MFFVTFPLTVICRSWPNEPTMVNCLFSLSADTMAHTSLYQRNLQGACDSAVATSFMNWSALPFIWALFGTGITHCNVLAPHLLID